MGFNLAFQGLISGTSGETCFRILVGDGTGAQNCALLGYYIASSGNFLPMFWDNLLAPSSVVKDS